MAKVIILEGTSRTGKTTILNNLCSEFGFHSVFIDERRPEGYDLRSLYRGFMIGVMSAIDSFPKENFVIDRMFLTELVYAQVLNREPCISVEEIKAFCERHDVRIVSLTSMYNTYMQRNPKEGYTQTQHSDLLSCFEHTVTALKKLVSFTHTSIPTDNLTIEQVYDEILHEHLRT